VYNDHPFRSPGILALIGIVLLLLWGGVRIKGCIEYDQRVGGHLKRAADANQPQLALEEIQTALKGIDRLGLCNEVEDNPKAECFTSVFYRTPDDDIGFWRTNIAQTVGDLESLPAESSHLEVSNTLMKVRETLVDEGTSSMVTAPDGISIYPDNTLWAWVAILGTILLCIGFVWLLIRLE
jgi:hypothetical protein